MGIVIFKGFTARRLYKSFGVKGLRSTASRVNGWCHVSEAWVALGRRGKSMLYKLAVLRAMRTALTCMNL
jgi:hypothetical protein